MKAPLSVLELTTHDIEEPMASNIREEVERLKSDLQTALHMARLRSITQDFHVKRLSLTKLLQEVNMENRRLYIRNQIYPKITIDVEDDTVYSDEKWLYFNFEQLIQNAVKYTADRSSEFYLSVFEQNGNQVIEIKDNGVGIPKADLERIFELFFTGENGWYFRESTGVGLYLVKEITNYLDHEIEVDSVQKKGTTFRIIFS